MSDQGGPDPQAAWQSAGGRSAMDVGNAAVATQRADEARTRTLVAVGVGLVIYLLYLVLVVLGS